jgi:hypothetical protein
MVLVSSKRALDFACHSPACRPPKSGGTGGSGGKGKRSKKNKDDGINSLIKLYGHQRKKGKKVKVKSKYDSTSWGMKGKDAMKLMAVMASGVTITPSMAHAYELACRSAACRPPTSGGTGGSTKSSGGGNIVQSRYGPNQKFRKDGTAVGEGYGGKTHAEWTQSGHTYVKGTGWVPGDKGGSGSGDRFDQEIEYEQGLRQKAKTEVRADLHPDYKRSRTAEEVGAMDQADAIKLIRDNDATGRRILDKGVEVQDGQPVGVRANLNVKKTTGVTVQTMHQGTEAQLAKGTGMFAGEAIGYGAAVTLRDVNFSVNQEARAKILTKETNKFPMASVDGRYVSPEKVAAKAKYNLSEYEGVEVRFNPMTGHLFTDPQGRAVKSASEATVVGSQVFVRGTIKYYSEDDMPQPARGLPTIAHP